MRYQTPASAGVFFAHDEATADLHPSFDRLRRGWGRIPRCAACSAPPRYLTSHRPATRPQKDWAGRNRCRCLQSSRPAMGGATESRLGSNLTHSVGDVSSRSCISRIFLPHCSKSPAAGPPPGSRLNGHGCLSHKGCVTKASRAAGLKPGRLPPGCCPRNNSPLGSVGGQVQHHCPP